MNCQFCFTGRRGLLGNLSTAQIIEQVPRREAGRGWEGLWDLGSGVLGCRGSGGLTRRWAQEHD